MKKLRIEIQSIFLAFVIIMAVVFSGYYFFRSLAGLVNVVHQQSQTDPALVVIDRIVNEFPEIENQARLFILSGTESYLEEYQAKNDTMVDQLQYLVQVAPVSNFDRELLDSLRSLSLRRLIVWNEILDIHLSASDEASRINDVLGKLPEVGQDTLKAEPEKRNFLARLFKRQKDEAPEKSSVTVAAAEDIRNEFMKAQRQIEENLELLKTREAELIEANQDLTNKMSHLTGVLAFMEKKRLEKNTAEADKLAITTKNRITVLGIFVVMLVMSIIFLLFRFLRKNSETQKLLLKAKAGAEELARTKELFIANVSHEMKTPLNAIYGITEQMLQRDLDQHAKEELTIVRNSSRHLYSLVNDTVDLARIHAGMITIHPVDFDPDEIFAEAIELVRPDARIKNLELRYLKSNEVPDALLGDPVRLKQMVLNLLSNALKFTETGRITLEADVTRDSEKYLLKVKVTDTGSGIPAADVDKVFEEFVQSSANDPARHRGTGLGLPIVRKLAEIQGGNVALTSSPGKGTTVEFTIPYAAGNREAAQKTEKKEVLPLPGLLKQRILVVDDEPYNRYVLAMILNKWGVRFDEAVDGLDAVRKVSDSAYDIVLMDVRMPGMDGYTASKDILKSRPDTRIIALTATSGQEERDKSKMAGMIAVLSKPFTEEQLTTVLNGCVGTPAPTNTASAAKVQKVSSNGSPDVDLAELQRMTDGNKEFFLEMIQIFIQSTGKGVSELNEAFRTQDFEALSNAAHKMASPVKHLRADGLYAKLKQLEHLDFRNTPTEKTAQLIGAIENEIRKINGYFESVYFESQKKNGTQSTMEPGKS